MIDTTLYWVCKVGITIGVLKPRETTTAVEQPTCSTLNDNNHGIAFREWARKIGDRHSHFLSKANNLRLVFPELSQTTTRRDPRRSTFAHQIRQEKKQEE